MLTYETTDESCVWEWPFDWTTYPWRILCYWSVRPGRCLARLGFLSSCEPSDKGLFSDFPGLVSPKNKSNSQALEFYGHSVLSKICAGGAGLPNSGKLAKPCGEDQ